jgi:hypothetical protein
MGFPFLEPYWPSILAICEARSRGRRYRALRPWWVAASPSKENA